MLSHQHGERTKAVNFLILMTAIHLNFVQVQTLIVIGKATPWENAAQICTRVYAILSNIIPIPYVPMKIMN